MASAPKLWNRLPSTIRVVNDLNCFKTLLKTQLFRQAFLCLLLWFVFIFLSWSNCIFLAFYNSFDILFCSVLLYSALAHIHMYFALYKQVIIIIIFFHEIDLPISTEQIKVRKPLCTSYTLQYVMRLY